ncbi:MAG: hypothetical protein HC836_44735 [Richelia sp. RM2_1_2]|nr:hypothetical protein [Richelia sp. SM2_1_7]NJO64973.1 hypothetical protein [Richelia sp. RM2_1_2]
MNRTVVLLLTTIGIFFLMPEKVDVDFKLHKRDVTIVAGCLTVVSLLGSNRSSRRYY